MIENPAFLRVIRDNPADDTARLVYADWLEEHDAPERAAFIRKQVEASRLPDTDPRRLQLENEADRLEALHGHTWSDIPSDYTRREYERGFLKALHLPEARAAYFKNTAAEEGHAPLADFVQASAGFDAIHTHINPDQIKRLQKSQAFDHVKALTLSYILGGHVDYLTQLPHLQSLTGSFSLARADLRQLAQLPLRRLESTSVVGSTSVEEALRTLCDSTSLQQHLEHLQYCYGLREPPAEVIPLLQKLEKLTSLDILAIGNEGGNMQVLQHLSEVKRLQRQLETLSIANVLDAAPLQKLTALKELNVRILHTNGSAHEGVTPAALNAFLRNDTVKRTLRSLDIEVRQGAFPITDETVRLLGECRQLRHLRLQYMEADIEALAATPLSTQLQTLDISLPEDFVLLPEQANALGRFTQLRDLTLRGCVGERGLKRLLAQPNLSSLRRFTLAHDDITAGMRDVLATCRTLPYLRELRFSAEDDPSPDTADFLTAFSTANADARVGLPSLQFVQDSNVHHYIPELPLPTEDNFLNPMRHVNTGGHGGHGRQ